MILEHSAIGKGVGDGVELVYEKPVMFHRELHTAEADTEAVGLPNVHGTVFVLRRKQWQATHLQGYRVWIFPGLASFARFDAELISFSGKSFSHPALFSLPRIDSISAVGVTRAGLSAGFRISAGFSGPLSLRLRRLSSYGHVQHPVEGVLHGPV